MRTYIVVVSALLGLSLGTSVAAADPAADVEQFLREIGLKEGSVQEQPPAPEPQSVPAPDADATKDGILASLQGVVATIAAPASVVGQAIMKLGLLLSVGVSGGVQEGGDAVKVAAASVVAHPFESGAIMTVTLAAAGIAIGLGVLAQRYGGLGGIPLYTRIAKSELLENKLREKIFELIQANPGINVSEIARRLDIAWGTATHHLHKLRHEKMVSIRIASNQKCYFPNGGTYTPQEMDVMSAVKNPTARQIADFLVAHGPTHHGSLAEALGLSPALVSFHARKLVEHGVVARQREGRHTLFVPLAPSLEPAPRPVMPH